MFLSPQVGPDIDPVTVTDLDRVFADRTFGEFLLLGNDGKYFVEAVPRYPGSDEYRIQWWNPAWPDMRATRELIYWPKSTRRLPANCKGGTGTPISTGCRGSRSEAASRASRIGAASPSTVRWTMNRCS